MTVTSVGGVTGSVIFSTTEYSINVQILSVLTTNQHGGLSKACSVHRYRGSFRSFSSLSPMWILSWCRCPSLPCCSLCPCRLLVDRDLQSLSNAALTWSKIVPLFWSPAIILSTRPAPALLAKLLPTQLWLPVDEHVVLQCCCDMVKIWSTEELWFNKGPLSTSL